MPGPVGCSSKREKMVSKTAHSCLVSIQMYIEQKTCKFFPPRDKTIEAKERAELTTAVKFVRMLDIDERQVSSLSNRVLKAVILRLNRHELPVVRESLE